MFAQWRDEFIASTCGLPDPAKVPPDRADYIDVIPNRERSIEEHCLVVASPFAGTVGAAGAATSAAAEPLTDAPWSLEFGQNTPHDLELFGRCS